LFGIRNVHVENGWAHPLEGKFRLKQVFRGIKRAQGATQKRERFPITGDIVTRMIRVAGSDTHDARLIAAALSLGFGGLLRVGEFAPRSPKSPRVPRRWQLRIQRAPEGQLSLAYTILASKTDPFRQGVTVRIVAASAVQSILDYLWRHPRPPGQGGFLLSNADGTPLTTRQFLRSTELGLTNLGITPGPRFTGVSLRHGAATTLGRMGVPERVIKVLGRWRSEAYHVYVTDHSADVQRYGGLLSC
jgi:integrase